MQTTKVIQDTLNTIFRKGHVISDLEILEDGIVAKIVDHYIENVCECCNNVSIEKDYELKFFPFEFEVN